MLFVSLIDSSCSMSPGWKWLVARWNTFVPRKNALTITFDTEAREVPSNQLSDDIYDHGGKSTDIYKAFKLFEEQLEAVSPETNMTVLFISNGEDTCNLDIQHCLSQLKGNVDGRKINFLCLGIDKEFSTLLFAQLRDKYPRGYTRAPAVFLIEYISEKAFDMTFESIREHSNFSKARTVYPPVCVFQWREHADTVYERSWVLTDHATVTVDGEAVDVSAHKVQLREVNELFRSWSQAMYLKLSQSGEDVRTQAIKTLDLIQR